MSSVSTIKNIDGLYFCDTKTANIYKLLSKELAAGTISSFSFESSFESEGKTILTPESLIVDGTLFENPISSVSELRNDLKFFFFLQEYLNNKTIDSFEILKYNASSNRKYNAKKTKVNGFKFDSRQEVYFYISCLLRQQAGEITNIELQPHFVILDSFSKKNPFTGEIKKYHGVFYDADFRLTYKDNSTEIIDVKGVLTDVFIMKLKFFEEKFKDLTISIVKQKKEGSLEFISFDEYEKEKKKRKKEKKLAEKNK